MRKVAAPHLGNLHMILSDLITRLGGQYVTPPPTSERTLAIGLRYSPEFACLPLKATIGNLIEALEIGADTLVMVGGIGPCRFGYYCELQKKAAAAAGYKFDFITVEPPLAMPGKCIEAVRKLAPGMPLWRIYGHVRAVFAKARLFDWLEKRSLQIRPYETERGATTRALNTAYGLVSAADDGADLKAATENAFSLLEAVSCDLTRRPLKLALVGEFYLLLEPFFKFGIEEWLGERGVLVDRATYLTDWVSPSTKNIVSGVTAKQAAEAAKPYLNHWVGGDGLYTVGHSCLYGKEKFDGIIQLLPFTCMPDTIAKAILQKIAQDFDIPIMSLVIDEQTGKAGVITRLEAFLDLVGNRAERKQRSLL